MKQKYFFRKRVETVVCIAVLGIGALYTLAPLWILFINSFKSNSAVVSTPLALPESWDLQYIINATGQLQYLKSIGITFIITLLAVTLIVLISSMSAWIMVCSKTKLAGVIFMAFVAAMFVPFESIMYPLIQFFDSMDLKNIPGLILMYGGFGLAMSTFLYHGFVKGVPLGVEEAAFIDGCNIFQMFFMIVIPMLKSITVTVIIITPCGYGTIICCRFW